MVIFVYKFSRLKYISQMNLFQKALFFIPISFSLVTATQAAPNPLKMEEKTFSPFKKWRGVFTIKPGVEVPFNFEITGNNNKNAQAFFINGQERFNAGRISWTKDSLFIYIDQFENELAFAINEKGTLHGNFRKQATKNNVYPVTATANENFRFIQPSQAPAKDISGTYDVTIGQPNGKEEKAVGLFTQDGNTLQASFLRVTGDSRFLDGVVDGDKFYLSSFIGSGVSYYTGTITNNGITGQIIGARSNTNFTATENEEAALPDAYTLTTLKQGYDALTFTFPDVNGKQVSLNDPQFKNKVVILSITGSWCPNCYDEASFLSDYYNKNKQKGVEVIALHYERQDDTAYVKKALNGFRKKLNINYTQLFAGIADKQQVALSLPALNTFLAFPTTIFIDKQGKVSKIHTGYSGPATGKFYDAFVQEFNDEVNKLIQQ